MALREEAFLDTAKLEAVTGVTLGVERPVEVAGNPVVLNASTGNPNYAVGYSSVYYDGSRLHMWTTSGEYDFPNVLCTYHYSDNEGASWTQPSLGQVTYEGSTANNIVLPLDGSGITDGFWHVHHEPTLTATPFVCICRTGRTSTMPIRIYGSADADGPFTLLKTVASNTYEEANAIFRRPDGRWVIYYQDTQTGTSGYGGLTRHLGAYLSDTSDITGAWTDQGRILTAAGVTEQLYHFGAFRVGEMICMPIGIFDGTNSVPPSGTFNGTVNRIWKTELWVSRITDGLTWTRADSQWVTSTGVPGEWDGGEIVCGNTIAEIGNQWLLTVGGDSNTHHQSPEGDRLIGFYELEKQRVGYIEGPGEVVLTEINALEAASLELNSEGTVTVELLDSDDQVIPGYSRSDSIPITTDGFANAVAWDDHQVTPADFKAVLILAAGARVYYLTAAEAPEVGLTLDESSIWTQDGYNLTVTGASANTRHSTTATVGSRNGGTVRFTGADAAAFYVSSDGFTWASSLTVPAGSTDIHVSVLATPEPDMASLSATMLIPV